MKSLPLFIIGSILIGFSPVYISQPGKLIIAFSTGVTFLYTEIALCSNIICTISYCLGCFLCPFLFPCFLLIYLCRSIFFLSLYLLLCPFVCISSEAWAFNHCMHGIEGDKWQEEVSIAKKSGQKLPPYPDGIPA